MNNAYSSKMLQEDNLAIAQKEITEEEFHNNVHKPNVKSVIGHSDTAKLLGLEENRETITLSEGDVLFVAELNNTTGTRLPVGVTQLEELPEGFSFRYLKIVCFKKPFGVVL